MPPPQLDAVSADELRAELEAIPEVSRAIVSGDPVAVHLVCRTSEGPPAEIAARAELLRRGFAGPDVPLNVSYLRAPGPERRARFLGSRVEVSRTGQAHATVALEWLAERVEGKAEGESGQAGEVRVAAQAAIAALERLLGGVRLQLVGTKTERAFDSTLVIVLLRATDAPERALIGVSIVAESLHRSAALAVLNATNALFGNRVANAE